MSSEKEQERAISLKWPDDIAYAIKMSGHSWSVEKTRGTEILCRANCTPGKLPRYIMDE